MPAPRQASAIQELLEALHRRLASCGEGAVADYIPELAKANPADFGIVVAMANGRLYAVGDTDKPFTIQSISKPFAYGLALQRLSVEHMQRKVGVEPSGEAFNAISLDPATGIPRNPMINAGAIATSAQIQALAGDRAEAELLHYFSQLAGRPLDIDQEVYASERDTGHRNRAISHLLRNFDVIEGDVEPGLDLYFRQCSIRVTCRDLGVMAATLACQGRNPLTGERPLDAPVTVQMLSLMGTCGMYDFAGQWLHDVGMPAKSGVGGGVLAVVPGQFGIATYSPPLDSFGNSVRGVAACRELSRGLGLHLYNRNPSDRSAISRSYTGNHCQSRRWRPNRELVVLRDHGDRLRVLHVQGLLDFYATEQLLSSLEAMAPTTQIAVLDLHQVQDVTPEALGMLQEGLRSLQHQGVALVLSRGQHLSALLDPADASAGSPWHQVEDFDIAMELAESLLLERCGAAESQSPAAQAPAAEAVLQALAPELRARLEPLLQPRSVRAGELVIRRGDDGSAMFFVESGRFTTSVSVDLGGEQRRWSRVATFTAGMCFGEISFLNGQPRTADVIADEDSRCLVLHRADFDALCQDDPQTATQLLLMLAGELGARLVRTSSQLAVMEHL
jgi:glutaminase